jgi:hypothetical protein
MEMSYAALSMRKLAFGLVALSLLLLGSEGGCGNGGGKKGEGEPCTRTPQCRDELVCSGGICVQSSEADAGRHDGGGIDAGGRDAGTDDGGAGDASSGDAGSDAE